MDVDHPGYGMVRMLGFPIKLSDNAVPGAAFAPALGEHSDEMLAELGYAASDRAAWRRRWGDLIGLREVGADLSWR